jgi:hypothetical protein
MNAKALLAGTLFGGLLYALSRPSSPLVQQAPAPDAPLELSAPSPSSPVTPVVVMVGLNVSALEKLIATQSYMEDRVPAAVDAVVRQVNASTTSGQFVGDDRTLIRSTPYGYLATSLLQWQGTAIDKAWLKTTVEQLIRARGGDVAARLRDVQVA